MAHAHILQDESNNIVIVTAYEAVTVTESNFLISVEILMVAEEYEDSIKTVLDSNENQDEGHSDTDEEMIVQQMWNKTF